MKFLGAVIFSFFLAGCATVPRETPGVPPPYSSTGIYHRVEEGETLWRISRLYNVDMRTLAHANSLDEGGRISKGQRLFIPGDYKGRDSSAAGMPKEEFIWPVRGGVTLSFATKVDCIRNKGIDIRAEKGAAVKAARSGRVVFRDDKFSGFGRTLIIDHEDGYQTVYSYASEILVKAGDEVRQHDIIARVGRTGRAKEPCLHFEIRKNGEPQNPYYYLP